MGRAVWLQNSIQALVFVLVVHTDPFTNIWKCWYCLWNIVPVVISLYWWCCFCLSLHTLAMACRSVARFLSMSYNTSLLCLDRFSLVLPALELSRKTLMSEWTQLIQTLEGLLQELLSEDLQTKPPKTFGLSKLCALSFGIADRV